MHTATIEAGDWWARSRGETAASWIGNYQNSLKSRHRTAIVEIVRELGNVTSVLEVGCHCGPNLMRLAQEFPAIEQLTGIDINKEAVIAGTQWANSFGLGQRIHLEVGRVPQLTGNLADGCVDVVLSCYALAYVAPADLDSTLWELGRLAKRAVILAEPMTDTAGTASRMTLGGYHEWEHNYQGASRWIGTWRGMTLRRVAVDPPVDRLAQILVAVRESGAS